MFSAPSGVKTYQGHIERPIIYGLLHINHSEESSFSFRVCVQFGHSPNDECQSSQVCFSAVWPAEGTVHLQYTVVEGFFLMILCDFYTYFTRVSSADSAGLTLYSDDESDLIRELQTLCSSKSEPDISKVIQ